MATTSNFGNIASLKTKLTSLEVHIKEIQDEISKLQQTLDFYKKEFNLIKSDKATQDDMLDAKKKDVVVALNQKLFVLDDELKKHAAHQKAENSRLQQQITQLKGDKTTINEQLLKLESELNDLQKHVGKDSDELH